MKKYSGGSEKSDWKHPSVPGLRGYIAGIPFAQKATKLIGIEAGWKKKSGEPVRKGEAIAHFRGTPEQVAKLENIVIGLISKPSGIATAAHEAKTLAEGKIRLVSGGWKKHPIPIKGIILEAVTAGGIAHRLVDEPFVYLDKNYARIFGGISKALQAVASLSGIKVIQLRGEFGLSPMKLGKRFLLAHKY